MILKLNQLQDKSIDTTTKSIKMRLSDNSNALIFKMFINSRYANPIGSIVREITSNCYDSHIEAGVKSPVLIKKSYDAESGHYNISFIDYGVGLSPDRVENIYGVLFESTKNNDNTQIGGYGIGSKTPLAYKRKVGYGTNEYDNSFFVVTNHNGTKYYYCIYEGLETPEINLMHTESTDEINGTEVIIPVIKSDISRFESEIVKQLYYFDNLVFEGFEDNYEITNDYNILNSDNFLFRGNGVSPYVHVCLGKVPYKIDYDILGFDSRDFQIPVALKFGIGDLTIIDSRENLDYSETTINLLKKRLKDLKTEFVELLSKQCDGIIGLEDYFRSLANKHLLRLTPTRDINLSFMSSDIEDVKYRNFKYNDFKHIPEDTNLFGLLFNSVLIGEKETRSEMRNRRGFNKTYANISAFKNLYYIDEPYKRNNIKIAYMKTLNTRSYIIRKNEFVNDVMVEKLFKNPLFKREDIQELEDEYWEIIKSYAKDYSSLEVPESFILEKKKRKGRVNIEGEIVGNIITEYNYSNNTKIAIADLVKFNGTIFYGTKDDADKLRRGVRIIGGIMDIPVINDYSRGFVPTKSAKDNNNGKHSLMFIYLAKNNLKYINACRKAIHINDFDAKFLYRYMDRISNIYSNNRLHNKVTDINEYILNHTFKNTFKSVADDINLCLKIKATYEKSNNTYISRYFDEKLFKDNKFYEQSIDSVNRVKEVNEYFNKFYAYIKIPYYPETNNKFYDFLKLISVDCDLLK